MQVYGNKKLLDTPYKLTSVQVAYQTPNWVQGLPSTNTGTNAGENGFAGFGPRIVKTARTVFPPRGLELVSADVIRVGGSVVVARNSADDPMTGFAVLRIAPVKGTIRSSTTTRGGAYESSNLGVNYEFKVELFDVSMRKPVWQATLDTNTLTAKSKDRFGDIGASYDDAFAQQVLEAIVLKMKEDGVM